jgi:hypothetical protein
MISGGAESLHTPNGKFQFPRAHSHEGEDYSFLEKEGNVLV